MTVWSAWPGLSGSDNETTRRENDSAEKAEQFTLESADQPWKLLFMDEKPVQESELRADLTARIVAMDQAMWRNVKGQIAAV